MKLGIGKKKYLALFGVSTLLIAATSALTFESIVSLLEKRDVFKMQIHPELEKVEKDEALNFLKTARAMFLVQMSIDSTNSISTRDAHAKGHGCAIADFEIAKNIPTEYRTGLFSHPGRNYQSIVRYSNGSGRLLPDAGNDARGMAIKVLDANRKNVLGDGDTQDFMMINFDRFFVGSAKDYLTLQEFIIEKKDKAFASFFVYRAVRQSLAEVGRHNAEEIAQENIFIVMEKLPLMASDPQAFLQVLNEQVPGENALVLMQAIGKKIVALKTPPAELTPELYQQLPLETQIVFGMIRPVPTVLRESFFSMSSYLLQTRKKYLSKDGLQQERRVDTAVKYISRPVSCVDGSVLKSSAFDPAGKSESFLKEDLAAQLAEADQCYSLFIQPLPQNISTEQKKKLVEDPRLSFQGSPEIAVAHIRMKSQSNQGISTPEQLRACEKLSYNPWHAGPEHRPLGALNRARKIAVTASSFRRHLLNSQEIKEPRSIREYLRSGK